MKIALLAPVALPVPPVGYGGTELVIHTLATGLVARGHAVTVFASGDSTPAGTLAWRWPRALEGEGVSAKADYAPYELVHVSWAMGRSGAFDVLHDHTKLHGTAMASFSRAPVVTTVHNDLTDERRLVYGAFPAHRYVAISRAHAERLRGLNVVDTIHNGLDLAPTLFSRDKGDYMLFLGRLDRAKGADTAAQLAERLDLPLIMAGRVAEGDREFFDSAVAPHLDGVRRRYVGEVSGRPKLELLAGARVLLFPIRWPEPFGLVMIEAMAAGTPVLATRCGSVGEVVEDGVTGAIAEDPTGLEAALPRALRSAPDACRARVAALFGADRMVEAYERLYARMIAEAVRCPPRR